MSLFAPDAKVGGQTVQPVAPESRQQQAAEPYGAQVLQLGSVSSYANNSRRIMPQSKG
jgi:hypothetical protein